MADGDGTQTLDLSTPEAQAAIADAVKQQVAQATEGLKNKNDELLGTLKKAQERTTELELTVKNVDPDEFKRLKEREEEMRRAAEEDEKARDKFRKELADEHTREVNKVREKLNAELETITQDRDAMQSAMQTYMVDARIMSDCEAHGAIPHLIEAEIKRHVRAHRDENGQYNVRVFDKEGDVRIDATTGEPMLPSKILEELRADDKWLPAFRANGASGTGTPARRIGANGSVDPSQMSAAEKIAVGLRNMQNTG